MIDQKRYDNAQFDYLKIMYKYPREEWKNKLQRILIPYSEDARYLVYNGYDYLNNHDTTEYILAQIEEFDPKYKFPFEIGDTVTLKNQSGVYIITNLPILDMRRSDELRDKNYITCISEYGSTYYLFGYDSQGNLSGTEFVGFDNINYLSSEESIKNNIEKIDYEFIEGELLYYVRELYLGKYKFKDPNIQFSSLIENNSNSNFGLGSIESKMLLESIIERCD